LRWGQGNPVWWPSGSLWVGEPDPAKQHSWPAPPVSAFGIAQRANDASDRQTSAANPTLAAPAAGVTLACSCSACGAKDYLIAEPSRLINPAAWDGSDLFIVWPLPGYRFASNRLATILRQEKISGVELIPARKIPLERGDKLGPGSIKYCMPEDRARELSRRFGIF
jgi:hypothetical protein